MNSQAACWPENGILVVVGPTASGKSELAAALAQPLNAEIISADSRQIYAGIERGTGKPGPDLLARAPHHLLSCIPAETAFTAANFAERAEKIARDIRGRGKRVLVAGGTGLWIRAFIDRLDDTPPPDPAWRALLEERIRSEGLEKLHAELSAVDPGRAARIAPADRVRIVRALEIFHAAGRRPTDLIPGLRNRANYPSLWIGCGLARETLYARAEQRIDDWLTQGWLEEVRALRERGADFSRPAYQAIGYTHLASHLDGSQDLERAIDLIRRDTRRYIKRQLTWFRSEKRVHWIAMEAGTEAAAAGVMQVLRAQGWIE